VTATEIKRARAHLRKTDPVLRRVIEAVGVYRIRYRDDPFAALVEAIIAQQVSVGAARAILKRLLDLYPRGLTPRRLLNTPEDALRSVGLSRQKTSYLHGLARQVAPAGRPPDTLTERETELLRLVAVGLPNKAIGQQLGVSENTVKYHMKNILQKLHLHNRAEAAAYAVQNGLLRPAAQ